MTTRRRQLLEQERRLQPDDAKDNYTDNNNNNVAGPQDYAENNATTTDEEAAATTELDDCVKMSKEEGGCSSPIRIDDYDDEKDRYRNYDGSNVNKSEFQALRRASIITPPQGNVTQKCLPEDTFSFVIYSHLQSRAFVLATLVFSLQIAIFVMLTVDIIDVKNTRNPMKLPPNVETPVRITETLAIVIAIITQDDVRMAVNLLREGFDKDMPRAFPGATIAKWILSIVLRATEGLLGLFVTFLLIMQSSTVLDLLLNFSAMEFVTLLDDVVFSLVKEGFLGRKLKKEAKKLSNTYYHVSHLSTESKTASFVTAAYFIILFTIMFAAWGIIFAKQSSGKYSCYKIFAQFGDEVVPMLGTLSGLFYRHTQSFGGRLSYRDDRAGGALLAYCHEDERWTLSLTTDNIFDPCDWYAASEKSVDFDVLTTASSPWVVKTATKERIVPLSQHFLACHDCMYIDNFCGDFGKCIRIGDEEKCECFSSHYGWRCEYPEPCQKLEIDPRDNDFISGRYFASKYYRLEGAEAYNRPIYTSRGDNQTLSDATDIILFTGVRWILSYKYLFPGLKDINDTKELGRYFSQFHGQFTDYKASFLSEPIHIDTPLDATASPLSVRWRYSASNEAFGQRLQPDLGKELIETSFFCAVCNNSTNPCQFGGVCQLNGTCGDCPNGSSGTMCQIPPTSNGECNPYFNNINFGFDGGDCCDNTCRSTSENTCGKSGQGYIDNGYPSCESASNQWELSGDPVYGINRASRSGVAVALGGRGKVLAVADPGVSIVRLFDKEGSNWIERGQVQGPPESNFGLAISMSQEAYNIAPNPRTSPTVTLAVGAPKLGLVRVFTCSTIGCIQIGADIVGRGRFGNSLSIAKDGNSIAIGGADMDPTDVKVFTLSKDTNGSIWEQKGNSTIATPWSRKLAASLYFLPGYYVSLSDDYLAVGSLHGCMNSFRDEVTAKLTIQVYKWDEITGWGWAPLGDEIVKNFHETIFVDGSGVTWPLKSVVIKERILAICSSSSIAVYEWNVSSSKWIPREIEFLESSKVNFVGCLVDLSEDANILAVAEIVEIPQPNDESIRMYEWDGKRYNALSNGVPGGPANSVSLSGDGKAVAIGLPFDASKGGSTRVYSFYSSFPCEDPSEILLRISFTTDGRPEETSWELRVDSEVKWRSGSLSGYMYTTFVEEMCIPVTSCTKLVVYDSRGDGLNPPGVFSVMLNGKEAARGGDFEFYYVKGFGNCECPENEAPFTLNVRSYNYDTEWSVLEQHTLDRYAGWKLAADWSYSTLVVNECIPNGCYYLFLNHSDADVSCLDSVITDRQELNYNATYNGESIVSAQLPLCPVSHKFGECSTTNSLKCGDGSNLVKIEISVGEAGTYWALMDEGAGNATILGGSDYNGKGATIVEEICKPTTACYYFSLGGGAGALIFLDGREITNMNTTHIAKIGDSCSL